MKSEAWKRRVMAAPVAAVAATALVLATAAPASAVARSWDSISCATGWSVYVGSTAASASSTVWHSVNSGQYKKTWGQPGAAVLKYRNFDSGVRSAHSRSMGAQVIDYAVSNCAS